jgi:hypothetical protein
VEGFLFGEEGIDRNRELASDPFEESQFRWTGLKGRHRAEAECSEPVITRGEWDEHYGADPDRAGALYEFGPASLVSEGCDYQWPLVEPNPPGWILIDRKPKVADNRISGLMPGCTPAWRRCPPRAEQARGNQS